MNVGDLVKPNNSDYPLPSGASYYDFAVVVSVEPFVLVSEKGTMRWEHTIIPDRFHVFGTATDELLKVCMSRL